LKGIRGTLFADVARKMAQTAEMPTEIAEGKRWLKEFKKGTERWMYVYQLFYPAMMSIKYDGRLTSEQRMIAQKEFWRRLTTEEGFKNFLIALADECKAYALAFVVPAPKVPMKPSAGFHGGLIV